MYRFAHTLCAQTTRLPDGHTADCSSAWKEGSDLRRVPLHKHALEAHSLFSIYITDLIKTGRN